MRPTSDPVAYSWSHPEAKGILYLLADSGGQAYEDVRRRVELPSETFRRVTRRLAQFDLLSMRAAKGAEFSGRRIRVVLEVSARGLRILPALREMDKVLVKHKDEVGADTVERLVPA